MLTLYYIPGACSTVPHVALEWSGLAYNAQAVSREKIKSAEYLALNPQGQVPLLVDGDWTLTQNVAIVDYINDLAPDSHIFSAEGNKDVRVRARARQWLTFANSDLHKAFGPLFAADRMVDGEKAQNSLRELASKKILSLYAEINKALQHRHFLASKSISIADVYVFVTMAWAEKCQLDLSSYKHLTTLRQRVLEDAGVQRVLDTQGKL